MNQLEAALLEQVHYVREQRQAIRELIQQANEGPDDDNEAAGTCRSSSSRSRWELLLKPPETREQVKETILDPAAS
jgi:hypothetical protein